MAWRLHPTGSRRTTLPVARHIERPPADGHRTAHLAAAALPPPARPRTPASTAGRRTTTGPRDRRGGRVLSTGSIFASGLGCAIVRCQRPVPPIPGVPAVSRSVPPTEARRAKIPLHRGRVADGRA